MTTRLTRAEDLPLVGIAREQLLVDFKAQVDPKRHFELAKDVAAFANASGGVVLVGAVEENGKLARYNPLPEALGNEIRAAYSQAVRDRCSPVPLCDPVAIATGGGFVIAVSVWPFPTQPVGVKISGDRATEGHAGPGWVFPLRTGVDSVFVRPEQLPMLMLPDLRRMAILLDAIPNDRRADLAVTFRMGVLAHGSYKKGEQLLDFVEVRLLENVAVFRGAAGKMPETLCHVPLDGIESVWSTGKGWRIAFKGFVHVEGRDLLYVPVD